MSIDVYAFGTSNGLRALIMLEEVGEDYTLHKVNLLEGAHKAPEFLKLNPMAQIPVMVDHDGPGGAEITLEQSVAIMMYLAEKHDKFLPKDPVIRAEFWQALMGAATDVGMTTGAAFTITRMPEPHQPSQKAFEDRLRAYLTVWDERLSGRDYVVGDEVTVADLALYPVVVRLNQVLEGFTSGMDNLERWVAGIGGRPAVAKAMGSFG